MSRRRLASILGVIAMLLIVHATPLNDSLGGLWATQKLQMLLVDYVYPATVLEWVEIAVEAVLSSLLGGAFIALWGDVAEEQAVQP